MNIIERSIRQPVAVTVFVLIIVIFGIVSLNSVPVQLTPNVDQPVVTVTTTWFGASPQEIEREIVDEQEDVLKTVSGVQKITSTATEGSAKVRLEFPVGVDKTEAMNEVRDKLRQVPDYPDEVDEPVVEAVDEMNRDYIAWYVVRRIPNYTPSGPPSPGYNGDITHLGTFFQDYVKPVMERAEGVSEVQVLGGLEREVQIRVDLDKLAARGITVTDMVAAIRDENTDVTAGTIDEGKRQTSVRVLGQFDDVEKVADTVVAYSPANQPIYVHDVAEVVSSFKKETTFVNSRAEPVIALNAQREVGSNVIEVMDNLKAAVKEINEQVIGSRNWGIEIQQVYDQTVYIHRAVDNAKWDLILGAILAGLVLLFTLRSLGATVVVLVAIPISVIGTFVGMRLFGRSLNVISIAGLVFAVGMGIDNAIVVLENIFRHREMGKDRMTAALDGTKEVWGAVLAATLVNLAVFLPIVTIQEEAGQLFRDLSVALTISFLFYLFVSPTVIPMLATVMLRKIPAGLKEQSDKEKSGTRLGGLTSFVGRFENFLSTVFYKIVLWLTQGFIRRAVMATVLVGASIYISYAIMPPRDYLPPGNQNFIFGILAPPPGYNLDEYRGMATQIEGQLQPWWNAFDNPSELPALQAQWKETNEKYAIPGIEASLKEQREGMAKQGMPESKINEQLAMMEGVLANLKSSPPPPSIEHFFFVIFGNTVFMGGSSGDPDNVLSLTNLFNGTVQGIPGTFGFFMQMPIFQLGGFGGNSVELAVYGTEDDAVRGASMAMMGELAQTFGYPQSDPTNFHLGRDEVQVVPDRVRAASANVGGVPNIRDTAQVAVDGLVIGDFRLAGDEVDLTLVSNRPRDARDRSQLADIPLATRDGGVVPLSSVAHLVNTTAPQQINHIAEQPSVTFNVQLPPTVTIEQGVNLLQQEIVPRLKEKGALPPGVGVRLEGSASKLQQFQEAFKPGFVLAALITYLLLAALFESWIHPFTIIMSVPSAMVGGFAALALLHAFEPTIKLDVLTMLGFVILIGTIVNNPILIVHQALNNMREGMERRHAIAYATQTRVRPIFMSVITSVAGMAPLVLFGGAGSELYRGLGAVVVGGLLVSTVFTLFLTPTIMSLMIDISEGIKGMFKGGRGRSGEPKRAAPISETELQPESVTARSIAPS